MDKLSNVNASTSVSLSQLFRCRVLVQFSEAQRASELFLPGRIYRNWLISSPSHYVCRSRRESRSR